MQVQLTPVLEFQEQSKKSLLKSVKQDQVARSTKISGRWKFFVNDKGREH